MSAASIASVRVMNDAGLSDLSQGRAAPSFSSMFVVNEEEAAAIRRAWDEGGELAAVVELRRHFPLISDGEAARRCVRTIVGWQQRPAAPEDERD
jgi:hypothetical protein